MRPTNPEVRPYLLGEYQIKVQWEPNRWERFWGKTPQTKRYVGSGTVYHEYPSAIRCSTPLEGYLADQVVAYNFQQETKVMAKKWVVMGNDYPSGVYSSEEKAQKAIAKVKLKDPPDTKIYWRSYEFEEDADA